MNNSVMKDIRQRFLAAISEKELAPSTQLSKENSMKYYAVFVSSQQPRKNHLPIIEF